MKYFHLITLRLGMFVGMLLAAPAFVFADGQDTWMITYFPTPSVTYENLFIQRASEDSLVTPKFTIGTTADEEGFSLTLGSSINLPSFTVEEGASVFLRSPCSDIPTKLNGNDNPAYVNCINNSASNSQLVFSGTDIYTDVATFGTMNDSKAEEATLNFEGQVYIGGAQEYVPSVENLGGSGKDGNPPPVYDIQVEELLTLRHDGKMYMITDSFTDASLPFCDGIVSWQELTVSSKKAYFLECK